MSLQLIHQVSHLSDHEREPVAQLSIACPKSLRAIYASMRRE